MCVRVFLSYTSGDVRLWDTLHWDATSSFLKANSLSAHTSPRPHVSHVQVNATVAAAAYQDGGCSVIDKNTDFLHVVIQRVKSSQAV